ncbi:MAG: flagellar biosynthetic protein FliR, partial [Planctomycetota bacterium]
FYTGGGFLVVLSVMFESYVLWPITDFYPNFGNQFPLFVLGVADDLMRSIVLFAAPVVITVFISEFGLGLMNRFAPQLNVFSLSMPVKSIIAMVVLVLYVPFLMEYLADDFAAGKDMGRFFSIISP